MTDEEIVKLVCGGKQEKYGEIVVRYQGKLFRYIRGLTNQSKEEVEDLLQEVMIAAYENINEFDGKKKFGSWIYRIAHNKVIDYFRKKKIKIVDGVISDDNSEDWIENLADESKLAEELAIEKEEKEELIAIIGQLEVKYREIIMLYFFEEKSYEEISDILHIPVNNVGVLLYRGKKKLKERLIK